MVRRAGWLLLALFVALPAAAQTIIKDSRGRAIQLLDTDGVTVLVQWSYQGLLTTPATFWVNDWTDPTSLVTSQTYTAVDSAREAAVVAMLPQLTSQAGFDAFSAAMAQDFAFSEIATVAAAPIDITSDFLIQATDSKALLYFVSSGQDTITLPVSVVVGGGTTLSFGAPGQQLTPGSGIAVTYPQQSSTPTIQVLTQPSPSGVPLPYDLCVAACKDRLENWIYGCGIAVILPPPIDEFAVMCLLAAKALELQCIHTKCPPPPTANFTHFWCDETVTDINFMTQSATSHCGGSPVELMTTYCDLYVWSGRAPPNHFVPELPLKFEQDPNAGSAVCLEPGNPIDRPAPSGVFNWGVCSPQSARPGWYFRIRGGNPASFCAGGML